jgi:hypothetical protein
LLWARRPIVKGIFFLEWHAIKSYSSYRSSKLGAQLEGSKEFAKGI